MEFNLEYGDWFMLDELQGKAVQMYGYESETWKYIRDLKYATNT